jgi:hypothetical protein
MYSGICACCFEPIKTGEETQLRENGRKFHTKCVEEKPNSYYVRLEKRIAKKN